MEITIDEVINRINDWKGKKIKYEELGGGITNHNYKVTVNGETFVVRIPGEKTEIFINRENELECSIEAGKTGVAPEVVYFLKPENVSVFRFIKGKTLKTEDIVNDNGLIRAIVNSISIIHKKARFKNRFNPFETIRIYMENYIDKYNVPLPDDIDWMITVSDRIEEAMMRNKPRDVACHNDYLSENFMFDGKKIWIIDWEYGGYGDPFFDLGDFAVEHPFSKYQEELIIKEYCGELKDDKLYRMLLYKIISDLWWGIWAMIQSKVSRINFDFYTYGSNRFERLRSNVKNKDYQKWLDSV